MRCPPPRAALPRLSTAAYQSHLQHQTQRHHEQTTQRRHSNGPPHNGRQWLTVYRHCNRNRNHNRNRNLSCHCSLSSLTLASRHAWSSSWSWASLISPSRHLRDGQSWAPDRRHGGRVSRSRKLGVAVREWLLGCSLLTCSLLGSQLVSSCSGKLCQQDVVSSDRDLNPCQLWLFHTGG